MTEPPTLSRLEAGQKPEDIDKPIVSRSGYAVLVEGGKGPFETVFLPTVAGLKQTLFSSIMERVRLLPCLVQRINTAGPWHVARFSCRGSRSNNAPSSHPPEPEALRLVAR